MESLDDHFLTALNDNLGIAHKVCRLYFHRPEEREDIFQEMMFQLCRSYPSFRGNARFSTWMYRVCLNTALSSLRNKKLQQVPLSEDHHQIAVEPGMKEEASMELLYQAIDFLSPINKALILLYLEDLSYEDIAEITGLSRSNVSVRLVRSKKELEKRIRTTLTTTGDGEY